MKNLDVRIIHLEPMLVGSVYGFGASPELDAWDELRKYAGPKNWLNDPQKHRIFGFNNPSPSPGSPNYGYELWIEVEAGTTPEEGVRVQYFAGGLYAVTQCEGALALTEAWKKLVLWQETSPYEKGFHQWLEHHLSPDGTDFEVFLFDLYLPVVK